VSILIAHTEARQDRLKAKAAGQAAQEEAPCGGPGQGDAIGPSQGAEDTAAADKSSEAALPCKPAPEGAAEPGEPNPTNSTEPDPPNKGHGRNGQSAFRADLFRNSRARSTRVARATAGTPCSFAARRARASSSSGIASLAYFFLLRASICVQVGPPTRSEATPQPEEPYALIGQVRIFGRPGGVNSRGDLAIADLQNR
jgi:hypothetical protein